jgi:hypothetical protein
LARRRRAEWGEGLRIAPQPGGLTLVLSYDPARARQILAQNRRRFGRRFFVNIAAESVEAEDEEGRLERYKVVTRTPEGEKTVVAVSLRNFLERMVPQLEDSLVVMYGGPEARRLGPPPLPRETTALVLIVETMDDVPEGWERDVREVVEAYYADEEETREALGEAPRELRGVLLGELERLARLPRERWAAEADRMRATRLAIMGLGRMPPGPRLRDIPLDGYLRAHLLRHEARPGCVVLTGAPGSGKTTVARALASAYGSWYMLDAGRVLERGRTNFLGHVLAELRHMGNVALVVNELDHLVLAERRYMARLLSFLEENESAHIAGTVVDISPLLREQSGTYHSELLRPGRVSEVVPVPPPFSREAREGVVRGVARSLGVELDGRGARLVAGAAPLLYPSDYISLVRRYAAEGAAALRAFAETYDLEARAASVEALVEKCERLGNTSTSLLDAIRDRLEDALNWA